MEPIPGTRRALVTGSARGIGRAIVAALAEDGLEVIGVDVLEQEVRPCSRVVRADLARPDECRRVLGEAGPVDVLVNNAAILVHKPIDDFMLEDFDQLVAVNLRAPFLLTQGVVGPMSEQGFGRIVNIASIGARTGGVSYSTVYAATKAGLVAMTKGFARHYGPNGITANAVCPGAIETFMTSHIPGEVRAQYISQIPLRRFADPSEVGPLVAFLASDAAGYVTGATIDVNGGWVMA